MTQRPKPFPGNVPLHAAEHLHAITVPIKGLKKHFPTVRDFDGYTYFKEESGGILIGGFEPVAKPWGMKGIPESWKYTELPEDWDQLEIFMECGFDRFPDNEPRYPACRAIMKAKKKRVDERKLEEIGIDPEEVGVSGAKVRIRSLAFPFQRAQGKQVDGHTPQEKAAELVRLLKEEARVI